MTSRAPLALAALSLALLGLAGCSSAAPEASDAVTPSPTAEAAESTDAGDCAGVVVIVDTADLETPDDPSLSTCVDADAPVLAADLLAEAGVTTEGTQEYGDQVVCRVNGVPAEDLAIPAPDGTEYHEACASMPAAFAYWSLWVRPADGEWGYAQEGLETLEVAPGDSLELLFTLNDQPASPTS
ncbi:hypothetical protein ACDF64_02370 [Agromyces sp. MMS24-JH15]|uniref:hypothetical protein n=1 Tax=Agromyces sp. MMS24-JH15 TaxID=3243765 RepID=UPI0037491D88